MSQTTPLPPLPPPATPGWLARFWYGGLSAQERVQAEAFDRRLLGLHGLKWWICAIALWMAALGLLIEARVPVRWGWPGSLLLVGSVAMAMRTVWLQPARPGWQHLLWLISSALGVMLFGLAVDGHLDRWWPEQSPATSGQAGNAGVAAAMLFTIAVTLLSRVRAFQLAQARRLESERDAAARLAAEAHLHLLKAQTQPHFLFNTLAALQHWVDVGDTRGPGLLHELTSLLRDSTELLAREQVTLADELAVARHYLAIMQVRLGERLTYDIDVPPECLAQPLPAGVLLTLLDNAVEHGIAPSLRPGRITLRAVRQPGRFALTLRDTGVGLAAGWQEAAGLANSRARLTQRFGDGARLTLCDASPGTQAQVCIETAA